MTSSGLRVVDAGLQASVQDQGRAGLSGLGVPVGGAADRAALELVNGVLGNERGAAGLELTLTGGAYLCERRTRVAVGGAPAEAWVERAGGGRELVPWWTVVGLGPGDMLRIGHTRAGARMYVGFSGGLQTPVAMGARSTHVGAGFPVPVLRAGAVLPVADIPGQAAPVGAALAREQVDRYARGVFRDCLRVVPGPHAEMFDGAAMHRLCTEGFVVGSDSSRAGVRLRVQPALPAPARTLLTMPMCAGFIQVPGGGQAIILGREHPTTGGYPVLASVIAADLDAVGQLRPGFSVRFEEVSREGALRAWRGARA
ncbi:MAG: biotin-dependent carboxyltransferase family protein [Phycisphaerales bacterium]